MNKKKRIITILKGYIGTIIRVKKKIITILKGYFGTILHTKTVITILKG